jgi:hypothetical protein
MKYIKILALTFLAAFTLQNCSDDDVTTTEEELPDFSGTFTLEDQMGRPAINTVLVAEANKNTFNTTIPSEQAAAFATAFANRLSTLSPALATDADVNLLGLNATDFGATLATDVLTVDLDGTTTFFDGTNVLTGRALADDVITTELTLIFGGEDGTEIPTLSDDNVDANDKAFLSSFPYLATPH